MSVPVVSTSTSRLVLLLFFLNRLTSISKQHQQLGSNRLLTLRSVHILHQHTIHRRHLRNSKNDEVHQKFTRQLNTHVPDDVPEQPNNNPFDLFGKAFMSGFEEQIEPLKRFKLRNSDKPNQKAPPNEPKKSPPAKQHLQQAISTPINKDIQDLPNFSGPNSSKPNSSLDQIQKLSQSKPSLKHTSPSSRKNSIESVIGKENKGDDAFDDNLWKVATPKWKSVPGDPKKSDESNLTTFKTSGSPKTALGIEFGKQYKRSFDSEFKESIFDLFLDDLNENDVKLIDDDELDTMDLLVRRIQRRPGTWNKYLSIIQDSPMYIN